MKVKVMIRDGIIENVLADGDADIKIVDFDRNEGLEELYEKEYSEKGVYPIPFCVEHCEP